MKSKQKEIENVKQAVKEFAEEVLKQADNKAIFQDWYDSGELGGRLVGLDDIKRIINDLFNELYGADK